MIADAPRCLRITAGTCERPTTINADALTATTSPTRKSACWLSLTEEYLEVVIGPQTR